MFGKTALAGALFLMMLAASLRFYTLGSWSFAIDEVSTMSELRSLTGEVSVSPDSQIYRLPRVVPLGYRVIQASTALFGSDEFGSRVLLAATGAAMVGVVFLFLSSLLGTRVALTTGLLMAVWPEHVFQSQYTRYYIVAAFFSGVMLLAGAVAARRADVRWSVLACVSGLLAVLSHTLTLFLFPVVVVGIALTRLSAGNRRWKDVAIPFGLTAIALTAFFVFYLRRLLAGWNSEETWGYSAFHSLMASINMLSWPVALFAGMGTLLMAFSERTDRWYWLSGVAGWGIATVVFPKITVYHPAYVFSYATMALVMAGYAIAAIADRLRLVSAIAAAAWIPIACMVNLPALVSHYADGSRTDTRAAAQYVQKQWRPGDRVAAFSIGTFHYYARDLAPLSSLTRGDAAADTLARLSQSEGRIWVVVDKGRGGLPPRLQEWLFGHGSLRLEVEGRRIDYYQNVVQVFLIVPPATAADKERGTEP